MLLCSDTHKRVRLIPIQSSVDFTLTECSAMNIVTWNCHVGDSKVYLKFSSHAIEAYGRNFKGSMAHIGDLGANEFKDYDKGNIKPKELSMNNYVDKVYKSEQFRTSTKRLRAILDAKYKKYI